MARIIIFLASLIISGSSFASDAIKVWDYPTGNINPKSLENRISYQIKKVEFKPEETVVYLDFWQPYRNSNIRFSSETSLKTMMKSYKLISAEGIELDQWHKINPTCREEYIFHFEPLPVSTRSFDFMEGAALIDGFNLTGVAPRSDSLESSNWRDDSTGDWIIGFFPDFAVYGNRIWQYGNKDFVKGNFTITNGSDKLKIKAGKEKDGKRTLKISGRKDISASRIASMFMPDYPAEGGAISIVDNGYQEGDSVKICGYLKDMDADSRISEISVKYTDIFKDEKAMYYAPVDSQGIFSITFPVHNTQTIDFMIGREYLKVPVEPNETYFLLYDFSTKLPLWMGDKSRLLNELASHTVNDWPQSMEHGQNGAEYALMLRNYLNHQNAVIDSIAKTIPGLSPLWSIYMKRCALNEIAFNAGQSRFSTRDFIIPKPVREFILENIWKNISDLPLSGDLILTSAFLRDFIDDGVSTSQYRLHIPLSFNRGVYETYIDIDPEKYEEAKPIANRIRAEIDSMRNSGDLDTLPRQYIVQIFDTLRNFRDISGVFEFKLLQATLDSLHASPLIHDIAYSQKLNKWIDDSRKALPDVYENLIDSCINLPIARNSVHASNEKYKQIASIEVDLGNGIMVKAEDLAGVQSGKELFDKVMEPFRGRIVLVDVWGTWCGPCKAALKEFSEERTALDPYGVVYMFFANNSEEEGWKNVIAEYGVTGENVVHYNLPGDKQQMLENYLKVSSYPSYRLVNKDGTLLDINADPRHISDSLLGILRSLTSSE